MGKEVCWRAFCRQNNICISAQTWNQGLALCWDASVLLRIFRQRGWVKSVVLGLKIEALFQFSFPPNRRTWHTGIIGL